MRSFARNVEKKISGGISSVLFNIKNDRTTMISQRLKQEKDNSLYIKQIMFGILDPSTIQGNTGFNISMVNQDFLGSIKKPQKRYR